LQKLSSFGEHPEFRDNKMLEYDILPAKGASVAREKKSF